VKFDDSDNKKPGWKFAEYELKGVPVRLAMGPRDLENGTVEVARRDTLEKNVVALEGIAEHKIFSREFLTKRWNFALKKPPKWKHGKNLKKLLKIRVVLFLHIGTELRKPKTK